MSSVSSVIRARGSVTVSLQCFGDGGAHLRGLGADLVEYRHEVVPPIALVERGAEGLLGAVGVCLAEAAAAVAGVEQRLQGGTGVTGHGSSPPGGVVPRWTRRSRTTGTRTPTGFGRSRLARHRVRCARRGCVPVSSSRVRARRGGSRRVCRSPTGLLPDVGGANRVGVHVLDSPSICGGGVGDTDDGHS